MLIPWSASALPAALQSPPEINARENAKPERIKWTEAAPEGVGGRLRLLEERLSLSRIEPQLPSTLDISCNAITIKVNSRWQAHAAVDVFIS